MTLTDTRIRQHGERLYRRLNASSYLGAEASADACDMFVRRMRRYRDRHPQTVRVSDAFVRKCERWITANLLTCKKLVAESAAPAARKNLEAAQYWYAKSVLTEVKAEEATGERRAAIKARRADYAQKHRRALERLAETAYRPALPVLAKIAGVSLGQVRYALRLSEREMKAYFN